MGSRVLAFVAFALLGFAAMNQPRWAALGFGRVRVPELYVSRMGYRAAAGMPSAAVMTEMSEEEIAKRAWLAKLDTPSWGPSSVSRQPDYDWRMNQKDWRFRGLSMIPFGLLFIAVSLQRTKRAELASAQNGEQLTGSAIAMASVRGQGQLSRSASRPRQTLAEWISM